MILIYSENKGEIKVKGCTQSKYGDQGNVIQHNVIQWSEPATQICSGTLTF